MCALPAHCTASTNKPSTIPFSSHILTFIWHTKPHGSFWGTLTPYVAWWSISSKESFWKTDQSLFLFDLPEGMSDLVSDPALGTVCQQLVHWREEGRVQCNQLSRSLVQVEPPDGFAQFLSHGKNCFPSGQNLPRRSQKGRALCPWTNSHPHETNHGEKKTKTNSESICWKWIWSKQSGQSNGAEKWKRVTIYSPLTELQHKRWLV